MSQSLEGPALSIGMASQEAEHFPIQPMVSKVALAPSVVPVVPERMTSALAVQPPAVPRSDLEPVARAASGLDSSLVLASSAEPAPPGPVPPVMRSSSVAVVDLSMLDRFGVRGPGAIAWLESQGVTVPEGANSWVRLPSGELVVRLGIYEFLVEDTVGGQSALLSRLRQQADLPDRVYPVVRSHGAILLWGEAAPEVLVQACWTNGWRSAEQQQVVTLNVAGVSVTLVMAEHQGLPLYQLWCDQPCGAYLCNLLVELAEGLGGGQAGIETLFGLTR